MGLKSTFVDTQFGGFGEFFFSSQYSIIRHVSNLPMILTLQCHLFHHIFCNGRSTLYSKMGRIWSISLGNGAQNSVCRHPLQRLLRVYFNVELFHSLSCFKLIPLISTLQCHLIHHIFCNGNSTLYSKMGAFGQYRGGMGLKTTFVDTHFSGFASLF